jgi:hypothetical protein
MNCQAPRTMQEWKYSTGANRKWDDTVAYSAGNERDRLAFWSVSINLPMHNM